MSEYTINSEYTKKVEKQFGRWASFLNGAIGVLAFTLGLASLGTPIPWASACASLLIVFFVWLQGQHHFPKELDKLRNTAKEDEQAEYLLRGLTSKHFSVWMLFKKYPLFLFGYVFLASVAISPVFYDLFVATFGSADWYATFYGVR